MSNIDKQALRERYSEKPSPKCHICGAVMSIQAAGAGVVTYGCTGRIDKDGEGYKFAEGRHFADDHYARSRVTDYSPSGDPEVLALLDEVEAKDVARSAQDYHFDQQADRIESLEKSLEAAEKRIAELEARTVKLPEPISVLHRRDFNDAHRAIYAYPEAEVDAALAAAGIGKGE